jgi:hypothetical protein
MLLLNIRIFCFYFIFKILEKMLEQKVNLLEQKNKIFKKIKEIYITARIRDV